MWVPHFWELRPAIIRQGERVTSFYRVSFRQSVGPGPSVPVLLHADNSLWCGDDTHPHFYRYDWGPVQWLGPPRFSGPHVTDTQGPGGRPQRHTDFPPSSPDTPCWTSLEGHSGSNTTHPHHPPRCKFRNSMCVAASCFYFRGLPHPPGNCSFIWISILIPL